MPPPFTNMKTEQPSFSSMAKDYFENEAGLFLRLGIRCSQADENGVVAKLPFNEAFLHNSGGNYYLSGIATIALDSIFGLSVMLKVGKSIPIATIDLKTDYVSQPTDGTSGFILEARCLAHANDITLVTGSVKQATTGQLLANANATFMVGTRGPAFPIKRSI